MSFVVSERSFEQEVLHSAQPVLVHFWAPWCGICRVIDPMLSRWQRDFGKSLKLVSINADENLKLANVYRLKTLPTLLFFKNGCLVDRLEDVRSRDGLYSNLEQLTDRLLSKSA